jgi:AcrR family transcriptional regulator
MSLEPEGGSGGADAAPVAAAAVAPPGRPRSEMAHRAILQAFHELLIRDGFARLRLEHVAARAGVSKATIYRRWASKEELAIELLHELAAPFLAIPDSGDTRAELVTVTQSCIGRLTESDFGPVVCAMLCEIAANPTVGDRFRAVVVQARRDEVRHVVERGIARGDLPSSTDPDVATELLIGPIYFRLVFGGALDGEFGEKVVDALLPRD